MRSFSTLHLDEWGPSSVARVCRDMRITDAVEVYPMIDGSSWQDFYGHLVQMVPLMHAFHLFRHLPTGEPVGFIGVWRTGPGFGVGQMIGTDHFHLVAKEAAIFIRENLIPGMISQGYRRVEARALASSQINRRWIELLGAHYEALLPRLGKNGECFVQYAWLDREGDRYVRELKDQGRQGERAEHAVL